MFSGSMVALVTPMHIDGMIDFDALSSLVEFHLAHKTDALVVAGSTGEAALLTVKERLAVIKHVLHQTKGRIPVIAGTGESSTEATLELTLAAENLGVDACLIMAPPYVRPTQEGLYLHFRTVARRVAIPQIIYNVPSRTACDILPETVARLAELPNIVGLKEATGQVDRAAQILKQCGERISIFSGDDPTALSLMKVGARGVISITANVAPRIMHSLCQAALAGEWERASAFNEELALLHKAMVIESNPIPVKWALHQLGLIEAGIRLPLTPLSHMHHEIVLNALRAAKINLKIAK